MRNNHHIDFHNETDRYPFGVPEGYFENLTERIMANLPEDAQQTEEAEHNVVVMTPRKSKHFRWLTVASAAASLVLIAVVAMKLFTPSTPETVSDEGLVASTGATIMNDAMYDDTYSEEFINYSMVDNSDIYNYLAGY